MRPSPSGGCAKTTRFELFDDLRCVSSKFDEFDSHAQPSLLAADHLVFVLVSTSRILEHRASYAS
jgi:hypothetical protein